MRTRRRFGVVVLGLAALVGAPCPASAGLMVFTDLASFQAATTGLTDVNFNGIVTSGNFQAFPTPPGFTRSGVNFDLNAPGNTDLDITAKDYYAVNFGGPTYPQDFIVNASNATAATQTEVITLPPGGEKAIGFDLGTASGQPLTFAFSTGDTFTDPSTAGFGSTSFLGFTSPVPITSVSITFSPGGGSDGLFIDDVKFGALVPPPPTVPEPSSLALLSLGLGLAGWRRWRKRATA